MTVRCVVCRTRRATFKSLMEHMKATGHKKPCTCSGYHHPHRPGSPCCNQNPLSMYFLAARAGEKIDPLDLIAEKAWLGIGAVRAKPNEPPPF